MVSKALLCTSIVFLASCDNSSKTSKKVVLPASATFKPVSYSLGHLEGDYLLLDSLRTLPKADSSLMKLIMKTGEERTLLGQFDSTKSFYRYCSLHFGPYRAEVVAVITEFNTVTASLQMLLFTDSNRWVSTTPLAFYYDEAGWHEDRTSTQNTPTTFLQQKLAGGIKEVPPKVEGQPSVYIGTETITTHSLLALKAGKITITRLDSAYSLTKE